MLDERELFDSYGLGLPLEQMQLLFYVQFKGFENASLARSGILVGFEIIALLSAFMWDIHAHTVCLERIKSTHRMQSQRRFTLVISLLLQLS